MASLGTRPTFEQLGQETRKPNHGLLFFGIDHGHHGVQDGRRAKDELASLEEFAFGLVRDPVSFLALRGAVEGSLRRSSVARRWSTETPRAAAGRFIGTSGAPTAPRLRCV
jgi:hypothetical protein